MYLQICTCYTAYVVWHDLRPQEYLSVKTRNNNERECARGSASTQYFTQLQKLALENNSATLPIRTLAPGRRVGSN